MQLLTPFLCPIEKIKPYPNNAKLHPDGQIDLLIKQIRDGFDQPIVVDKDYVIIKGHGRRLASLKMGLKEVPVIVRDDLTTQQVKAARIADNKLAETDWDLEALRQDLEALSQFDYDLEDLGFSSLELDNLLGELVESAGGTDCQGSQVIGGNGHSGGQENGNYEPDSSTKEIDTDDYEFSHTCPKCGFDFND